MRLRSLRIRNLLSFGQEPQELQLEDSPIAFIVGPNNSGKSNLFRTLSFVADCITPSYPSFEVAPYLPLETRDFEVAVEIELNDEELQALQDFLVCANMLYNPGGSVESQLLMRIEKDILAKYGDRLFGDLQRQISIVVRGTEREASPYNYFMRLRLGQDEFLLKSDGYLAKQESPDTSSFGFSNFSSLLTDDFKQRYPAELEKFGQVQGTVDGSYEPPNVARLLSSKLSSETIKPGQNAFAGIRVEQLNFSEFDRQIGTIAQLQRLRRFMSAGGLKEDALTFGGFIAIMYSSSIVWVADLRGRPPDHEFVPWEKPVEAQGPQIWGRTKHPQIPPVGADDLPSKLFGLLMSSNPTDQKLYEEIRTEFRRFTDGLTFNVYLDEKEVVDKPDLTFVRVQPEQTQVYGTTPQPNSAVFGTQANERLKKVKVVSLRMLDGKSSWPIRLASAGTVEVLSLLTAIMGTRDKILLLDEPAQNMHPEFQDRFLDLLRNYVKENSNQALVITHSPFLLRRDTLSDTWRVTRNKAEGTTMLCVMQALAKLDPKYPRKILQQLDSADVRSLLFSRGAVFVEGLTDKWILQEIDRKVSLGEKKESLVEKEWVVVSINTKNNTSTFLSLAELLGLDYAFLLDRDAEPIVKKILRARGLQQIDENAMRENGFFLLRTDIDDLFSIKERNKPLKGLERALSIGGNEIPPEFNKFLAFLKKRTKSGKNID